MNKKLKSKLYQPVLIMGLMLMTLHGFGRDFRGGPYDHRIVSVNLGYSFSGSGDCWGIGNEISHLKTFLPGIFHRESLSSWLVNGTSWIDGGFDHQSGIDFALELGISPFLRKNRLLSITGGGCVSYQTMFYPREGGSWYSGKSYKNQVIYFTEEKINPGFTVGLNYHTRVNTKIWLNARAAVRSYVDGYIVSILSVGIGFDPTSKK